MNKFGLLADFRETIQDLSACHNVDISNQINGCLLRNTARDTVRDTEIYLAVSDELKRALELDLSKMDKKKEKLLKELEKMNRMISGDTYQVNTTAEARQIHSDKVIFFKEKLNCIVPFCW